MMLKVKMHTYYTLILASFATGFNKVEVMDSQSFFKYDSLLLAPEDFRGLLVMYCETWCVFRWIYRLIYISAVTLGSMIS